MKYNKRITVAIGFIEEYVDLVNDLYNYSIPIDVRPLRSCKAEVLHYNTQEGDVYLLKSYNTIVAYVDENGMKYDFLRYVYGYTATSAQHIRKFFEDYGNTFTPAFTYKNR